MNETVRNDQVVAIHYTLTNAAGEELDTSRGDTPMNYLHGHGNIVPGLETALTGAEIGSTHQVVVEPAQGYGERSDHAQEVSREFFPPGAQLEPGMQIAMRTEDGSVVPLWVVDTTDEAIIVTADHPLAGVELHFDVEIVSMRPATAHEVEQGRIGCSCC